MFRVLIPILLTLPCLVSGQVVITEINAAPNERALRWDATGQPRLGSGPAWFDPNFNATAWTTGTAPLGFNPSNTGLGTNLRTSLDGQTASLYVRKVFNVSAANAASPDNLRLRIDYNDGFVAFLNGKEISRARLGAPKAFVYADQPAFSTRPPAPAGPLDINLGPASGFLVAGDNVLAIQVANGAIDGKGDLFINAGLELNNGILTTTEFTENFNNANGASRTHTNTAGTVTNTVTGTPPTGWLASLADPVSALAWATLQVTQTLEATGGTGNSGVLKINGIGTGAHQPVAVLGPPVSMAAQWTAGSVTEQDLDNTTLTLKVKAPAGYTGSLKIEPTTGGPTLSLGTLNGTSTTPTTDITGWWRFENQDSGVGVNAATMTTAPSVVNNPTLKGNQATANAAKFSNDVPGARILDPMTGAVYQNDFSMDSTTNGARMNVANNTLLDSPSFTMEFFIKLTGEPTGYDLFARRQFNGPNADSATSSDLRSWQIDFNHDAGITFGRIRSRWDTPGTTVAPAVPFDFNRAISGNHIFVDNPSGDGNFNNYGAPLPADVYSVGDQTNDAPSNVWRHVALTFDAGAKRATIFTDYVAVANMVLNGSVGSPAADLSFGKFSTTNMVAPASAPWTVKMDEVRYSNRVLTAAEMLRVAAPDAAGFTTISAKLSSAPAAERTAFLAALNGSSSQSFRTRIELGSTAVTPTPGADMLLEDVSVTYARQQPITPLINLGDSWNYFAGAAEPSNGVWEPNLPKIPNNASEPALPPPFPDLPGFADWVELHNPTASAVDLSGWRLSDDIDSLQKWTFPAGSTIPAGGYLLVLCDENHLLPGMAYLHTNFKLSEGGEGVYLSNPTGDVVDELNYPRVDAFTTYGKNASGLEAYFHVATPGAANSGPESEERCTTPDFFADAAFLTRRVGGFYTGAQALYIRNETPGAEVRYTLDGTEPTTTSLLYPAGGPLNITAGANDKTGRVIRARCYKAGAIPSNTKTITLLIDQNTALKGVPAMTMTGDGGRVFYKNDGVMAINGGTYLPDTGGNLNVIWSAPLTTDYSMGTMHGRPFEKPLHLEWFPSDGSPGFAEEAGIRIASSPFSRPRLKLTNTVASPWTANATEKPSFNLFFREDYDKGELDYPFLGQGYPVRSFDQLRPRAGKNDISNPFIKDELVRRLFNEMGHKAVQGQINTLYVNGIYKGFFNTVERYREPFFQSHFDTNNAFDIRINDVVEEGDSVSWNALIAAAEQNLSVKANWDAVVARIDLDEMIDYWILNSYMSMWDWPNNNWIASREISPEGKWRLHVWDGEGSFGHGNAKPPWYDTIGIDLRTTTGTGVSQQSRLFRGLWTSAEFKLRFADRVNRWFFNGNVLDDRVPTNCVIQRRMKELADPFRPLLAYTHAQTLADPPAFWTNWTNASTNWTWTVNNPTFGSATNRHGAGSGALPNRRAFLFGPVNYTMTPTGGAATNIATDISFRFHQLWPATEPVTFSQHGGTVPLGYNLGITTNATAPVGSVIYYTVDGTDPRDWAGTPAATATSYTTVASPETLAITLPPNLYTTVKARVRHATTNEWSALTEAIFQRATVPATPNNLVVSQIMYHPPESTPAEVAAGFTDKDDFEYLELRAIGPDPVSLDNVFLSAALTFDFGNTTQESPVRAVGVGETVLIVRNKTAFQLRYGNSLNARIAGEYAGSLSNNGERILLALPDGPDTDLLPETLKDFTYSDSGSLGWPNMADGLGAALQLIDPESNPNHSLPASWKATPQWAGMPGNYVIPSLSYDNWKPTHFGAAALANPALSGPTADPDFDGLSNLLEFALNTRPDRGTSGMLSALPTTSIAQGLDNLDHLHTSFTVNAQTLSSILYEAQAGSDLAGWQNLTVLPPVMNTDGTATLRFRDETVWKAAQRRFVRMKLTVVP
jgi:hypothetical protein